MSFKLKINSNGYSNLYGYGIPDLVKALGLNIDPLELDKLKTSQFNNNVALNALNALEAWQAGYTGMGVKVGVFDGGVGLNTAEASLELPNAILYKDAVDTLSSHGFRVSQYILAKNQMPVSVGGTGEKSETGSMNERDVTGVAFDAKFYFACADLHTIGINIPNNEEAAFQWFVEQGVDVINWSGTAKYNSSVHQAALKLAHDSGIIVVFAAGNLSMGMDEGRGQDILKYAQDFDNIIVASSTMPESRELYNYSNHSGDMEHSNFTVVEDHSYAFYPSGLYEKDINGTSFAAPYLTGVVALIIQKLRDNEEYDFKGDYQRVIQLLKSSSSIPNESGVVLSTDEKSTHDLTIIVDAGVLGKDAKILKDIVETIEVSDGEIVSHSLGYNGEAYDYATVDELIMTIARDGVFTSEFYDELQEFAPSSATLTYTDLVAIVGVANLDQSLIMIASSDGYIVG